MQRDAATELQQELAQIPEQQQAEYLKQLVATSERHAIEATEDIYNEHGVKLVSAGHRIDRKVYGRLIRYKLVKPIDASLGVQGGVDVPQLLEQLDELGERDFVVHFLLTAFNDRALPQRVFRQLNILGPLSVKLTVTHDQAADKYRHLIHVALAALYLGNRLQLELKQLLELVHAGLFHDLGEMHLDPAILDRKSPLTPEMRRQIYAHPLIISLILEAFPEYPPTIRRAVLEHHERLDGSGYPRGLQGDQISLYGRILAVAELLVVLLERMQHSPDWDYLSTSMKLNTGKYDEAIIGHLISLLRRQKRDATLAATGPRTAELWEALATLLRECPVERSTDNGLEGSASAFLALHMNHLKHQIARAGLDPDSARQLVEQCDEGDPALSELNSMAMESLYRISELLNEIQRRWAVLLEPDSGDDPLRRWLQLARRQTRAQVSAGIAEHAGGQVGD